MSEVERISRFLDSTEEAVCDEARPVGCGTALLTPSLPSVWQLNALRVEDASAGPDQIAAEAEEVLADRAHRQVFVPDSDQGAELAPELARGGWNVVRLLVMVKRGEPDRRAPAGLGLEVDRAAGAAALAAFRREQSLDGGAETIRELEEMDERFTRVREGRDFASPPEERHACCRLFAADGVGQVDQVCTLAAHRNRGYARAAILAALDAAAVAGLDPVFLLADAEEWPQHLYRRLGFEAVDMQWEFLKLPLRSSPP